ncbi:MAG: ABC transporter permease [Planctomycetes bacterium]|nr:ABC transporter permease [Planctomycetota bacterium]
MFRFLYATRHHRKLLWHLAIVDFRGKFVGSAAGVFWAVVYPIIILLLYWYIFAEVLDVGLRRSEGGPSDSSFALFMFAGMIPWFAFQEAIQRSLNVISEQSSLVKNVIFPAEVLPLKINLSCLFQAVLGVLILFVAVLIQEGAPTIAFLYVIPALLIQFILGCGVSLLVAAVAVYWRDVIQLTHLFLMIWMFVTPIFYPESKVPDEYRIFLTINPWTSIATLYRGALLKAFEVDPMDVVHAGSISVGVLIVGAFVFRRCKPGFSDLI